MKRFGKLALGAALMAASAMGATVATTVPASAAHVSVGIGIGVPGPRYVRPGYPCGDANYAYHHPGNCGGAAYYGPDYYGYYDTGFYGPGYYEPAVNGFWFTDSFGHRRYHGGRFHGGGFHGRGHWHR
jgi:hypothetical protein